MKITNIKPMCPLMNPMEDNFYSTKSFITLKRIKHLLIHFLRLDLTKVTNGSDKSYTALSDVNTDVIILIKKTMIGYVKRFCFNNWWSDSNKMVYIDI